MKSCICRAKRSAVNIPPKPRCWKSCAGYPIVNDILEYRQLIKLKSTYIDALPCLINPRTGRVHTSFNQTRTTTGRLSSSEPNLQNIPVRGELGREIRRAFIAPPVSILLAGDYSQIDLRVLAHLSQDESLLEAFRQDKDIHAATAAQLFGVDISEVKPDMRRLAKTVNFGVIYGMSEFGLEQATELSREEAGQFITAYFEKYPGRSPLPGQTPGASPPSRLCPDHSGPPALYPGSQFPQPHGPRSRRAHGHQYARPGHFI